MNLPDLLVKLVKRNRPKYNYTRTKSAEEDEVTEDFNTRLIPYGGALLALGGLYWMSRLIDTDWDGSVGSGATP